MTIWKYYWPYKSRLLASFVYYSQELLGCGAVVQHERLSLIELQLVYKLT